MKIIVLQVPDTSHEDNLTMAIAVWNKKNPDRVIRQAVWGMIPHNKLARKMIKKLKVYGGPEHEHGAQHPVAMDV